MSETKISQLANTSSLADTDLLYVSKDIGGGLYSSRNITVSNAITKTIIEEKLMASNSTNDGYLTSADWNYFNDSSLWMMNGGVLLTRSYTPVLIGDYFDATDAVLYVDGNLEILSGNDLYIAGNTVGVSHWANDVGYITMANVPAQVWTEDSGLLYPANVASTVLVNRTNDDSSGAKLQVSGDISCVESNANGVILKDRVTGTNYRLLVYDGSLGIEPV